MLCGFEVAQETNIKENDLEKKAWKEHNGFNSRRISICECFVRLYIRNSDPTIGIASNTA
jgi:hypothetical protein